MSWDKKPNYKRTANLLYGIGEPVKPKQARKKPVQRESALQKACVSWFYKQYPELYYLLWATPNGGSRNAIEGKRLKDEGVTAGVSDLIFCYEQRAYFIEMKTEKGRQTETQKEFQQAITQQGFDYYIIRSFEEFQNLIKEIVK